MRGRPPRRLGAGLDPASLHERRPSSSRAPVARETAWKGVHGELGAGQPLGDHVGDPARAVGDDLDAGALPLREQVEEGVELALAVPGAGPHDPSAVVVDHHGHVLAALLAAGLVDADRAQPVEPAPPVGLLERGPHAGAYPAHGAPVHPHELGEGAAAHVQRQPGHLVLEGRGEPARRRARPRDRLRLDAVLRALHAARRVLHVAAGGPDVGRPPAPGGQGIVAVAAPPAHRAPGHRPSRPCGDDYGVSLDSGTLDDGGAQAEGGLEYTLLHAAARLSPVVFSWSKNKRYAGRAAAARCRLLPSGQPTQTPEEPYFIAALEGG